MVIFHSHVTIYQRVSRMSITLVISVDESSPKIPLESLGICYLLMIHLGNPPFESLKRYFTVQSPSQAAEKPTWLRRIQQKLPTCLWYDITMLISPCWYHPVDITISISYISDIFHGFLRVCAPLSRWLLPPNMCVYLYIYIYYVIYPLRFIRWYGYIYIYTGLMDHKPRILRGPRWGVSRRRPNRRSQREKPRRMVEATWAIRMVYSLSFILMNQLVIVTDIVVVMFVVQSCCP